MSSLLSLRGVQKRFGAVAALAGVDLDVHAGEVHAVLGENGAGKSTLMNILYGLLAPDAGVLVVDGRPTRFHSALDARRAGIGMVHQEFALVDALSVAENLALSLRPRGEWRWRRAQVIDAAVRVASEAGLDLGDLDAPVGALPVGQRQRIEIVKALAGQPRVLILDEPTAVLTPAEVAQLLAVLDRLRRAGTAMLFITHKLAEVSAVADTVTVLRRGRVVARVDRGDIEAATLARLMVGDLAGEAPLAAPRDVHTPAVLRLDRVDVEAAGSGLPLRDISLMVRRGEIVAVAGVDGNGQAELFDLLAGLRAPTRGTVHIDGTTVQHFEPAALIATGVACIPPDRRRQGSVGEMSVTENAVLNARLLRAARHRGLLRPALQRAAARAMVDAGGIVAAGLDAPARSLSGGNLQKLVVARALATAPRLLVAANPTRGLDIGAARGVHVALAAAAAAGVGVALISPDLDEVCAHAHRVAVLYRGRLSASFERPFPVARLGAMLAGNEAV
jgi:simple sugar transport system ATP-binding protein